MINDIFSKQYYYLKNRDIYLYLIKRKRAYKDLVVSRDTDIVIEGFPRSANTFLTDLVSRVHSVNSLKIARHVHSRAQIVRGVKFQIPVVLLLRDPKSAVMSLAVKMNPGLKASDLKEKVSCYIYYYCLFHAFLEKYQESLLIVNFDHLVNDPKSVVTRIKHKFNMPLDDNFENSVITESIFNSIKKRNSEKVNYDVRQLAVPSGLKEDVYQKISYLVDGDENYGEACRIYSNLISLE